MSGEPAIAGCIGVAVRSSRRSDVYPGRCGRDALLFVDHRCVNIFIHVLNFPYFNSEIFPMYGSIFERVTLHDLSS